MCEFWGWCGGGPQKKPPDGGLLGDDYGLFAEKCCGTEQGHERCCGGGTDKIVRTGGGVAGGVGGVIGGDVDDDAGLAAGVIPCRNSYGFGRGITDEGIKESAGPAARIPGSAGGRDYIFARATAMRAAQRALLSASWTLEAKDSPPVSSLILASRNGVICLPWMWAASASASA